MLSYSILEAKASGLFDRIIVSTDDNHIAEVAKSFGAEIPFLRPAELADDHTGTGAVVRHAVAFLEGEGEKPESVCCVYATAPFLQQAFLLAGYEALRDHPTLDYAFSVTSYAFPIQRSLKVLGNGRVAPMFPEFVATRSQDLEEVFHDAGQFYWGRCDAFLADRPIFSPSSLPVVLPRYLVQDIDTEEDWRRAELMYEALLADGSVTQPHTR